MGKDAPKIGYIKLASFNQNASGMVQQLLMSYLWDIFIPLLDIITWLGNTFHKAYFPFLYARMIKLSFNVD